jgi:hypothetical protein
MTHQKYILVDGQPKPVDLITWAKWFEGSDRHVAKDRFGEWTVSTIFLGMDHRFGGDGPPLLFETMVLNDEGQDKFCERSATIDEARASHARGIAFAKAKLSN